MHLKLHLLLFLTISFGLAHAQQTDSSEALRLNIQQYLENPAVSKEQKIDTLTYHLNLAKQNLNTIDIVFAYQNLAAINYDRGNANEALRYYKLYVLEVERLSDITDIRKQDFEVSLYKNEIKALSEKIITLENEIEDLESTKEDYFKSNYLIYLGLRIVGLIAAVLFLGWIYIQFKNRKKVKESVLEKKEEKDQKLSELLVNTREQLNQLQTELNLSDILIQYSIPEPQAYFDQNKSIRKKFLLHQPVKLAGGDGFYLQSVKQQTVIAIFDAPGHGVSGGLLSSQIAKQIDTLVVKHGIFSPAVLLQQLESKIRSLFPAGIPFLGGVKIGICLYNSANKTIVFAGANINLIVIHKGIINRYRGEQQMILENDEQLDFPNDTIDVHKGMNLYLSTDGFWSQKGGHEIKPFGINAFEKALESMSPQSIKEHGAILSKILADWKGGNDQDDDILVFGFGF
ncbi:MAG: SpoIIE family protein phosphatase [Bacteroidota bacterium]